MPRDVGTLEVRLVGPDAGSHGARQTSCLSTTVPGRSSRPTGNGAILVVGEGDPYLETALSYLPNVELFGVPPAEYGPATERTDGRPWDLVIFEGALPATLPRAPILAIAPPRTSALGEVDRHADEPGHRIARPG